MLAGLWRDHQKLRFLVVGAWNTVFAYLAYIVLYALLREHVHYMLISTLAHACAVTNAFVCQRALVFHSSSGWLPAYLRFNLVQLLVLGWCLAALAVLVEGLHFQPFLSQLFVMTVAVVGGYLLSRSYAFRV